MISYEDIFFHFYLQELNEISRFTKLLIDFFVSLKSKMPKNQHTHKRTAVVCSVLLFQGKRHSCRTSERIIYKL